MAMDGSAAWDAWWSGLSPACCGGVAYHHHRLQGVLQELTGKQWVGGEIHVKIAHDHQFPRHARDAKLPQARRTSVASSETKTDHRLPG